MIAVTRDVSASINRCELTHVAPQLIDVVRARHQHEQYRRLLAALGCTVVALAADERYPDCVFVEDTAVVLEDIAVITRPGAPSRRGETRAIADALEQYRPLAHIEAPATLDGGDVLVAGERIYAGLSQRTNEAAIAQLRLHTRREVIPIELHGALHLKTAITRVSGDTMLVNRDWVDVAQFPGWTFIDVDPAEPFGANAMLAGETVVYPEAYPRTRQLLEARGLDVRAVDASELAKAEGGVTCCAILAG